MSACSRVRIACALGLLGTILAAQDRPETVIRTTTRLVQVRVMAEDAKGNPVTDLRQEELQLLDNRRPQPIDFLVSENGNVAAAGAPDTARDASSPSQEVRDDYAVILLDWLNPRYVHRISMRDHVNKLLRNFRPHQQVALYLLDHHPRLLHGFTSDPGELLQALANTPDEMEDPFDPSKAQPADPRFKTWVTLTTEEKIFHFNNKILDTTAALEKVADALDRVPGRKSLIWVSNGFPIVLDKRAVAGAKDDEVDYGEFVNPLIDRLNRANVAVYTVDARGLSADGSYGDVGTLQEFAERTGGTSFHGRNDLDEGMRLALQDTKISYTLGFTLPPDAAPGLHELLLRSKRPGVKLRYRESYQLDGR